MFSLKSQSDFTDFLSDKKLKTTCKSLGLPVGSRNDMINTIKTLIIPNHRHITRQKRISLHKYQKSLKKIIRIQRWWRYHYNQTHFTNDCDFLTLDKITVHPFCLVENSGHVYQFNPMTLAEYFVKEGNFVNPYTRKPLNSVELKRLDHVIKKIDPTFVSLYNEYKRITIQRSQEREHRRVCQLLHNECVSFILQLVQLIRNRHVPVSKISFHLTSNLFPRYFDTFRQLFLLDHTFACDSIFYTINLLQEIWNDTNITSTREACYIIETALDTLVQFMTNILPILPALLPEMMAVQSIGNVR